MIYGRPVAVFAIIGMGGLGKTLAQQVYNDKTGSDQTNRFKHTEWVNLSVKFNVDKIIRETFENQTQMNHSETSRSSIEKGFLNFIENYRFFILVLDDVRENELLADWNDLYKILSNCPEGATVLLTSRSKMVAERMGAVRTDILGNLPEEQCWDLFKSELLLGASTSDNDLEDKEPLGRNIIRKCEFLPLAVKSMAAILRGKPKDYWDKILKNGIWETDVAHHESGGSHILPALRLSYDYLPPFLKQCFAYCSIFPKGHKFDKNELVKLWIAEGYISHPTRANKLEDVAADHFVELHCRSFFQSLDIGSGERYRMHDLIVDPARFVSDSSQRLEKKTRPTASTRIAFMYHILAKNTLLTHSKPRSCELHCFPLAGQRDLGLVLHKLFKTLKCLRVLDLSSCMITDLPKSIGSLKLMRYLDLSRTEMKVLPSTICYLQNLQVLKPLGCRCLQGLPNNLGNLKELRHLELDKMFWYKCSALAPRLGDLTNLLMYIASMLDAGVDMELKS